MRRIPVLLALASVLSAAQAPANDPTGEEVSELVRINQFSADWRDCDEHMSEAIRIKELDLDLNQWSQSKTGAGASPPLVFNRTLMQAARSLLAQGAKPPDKKHFDATDMLKTAGYSGASLVVIVAKAPSLAIASEMAFTEVVGETQQGTNMNPVFVHQEVLKADYREAGVAVAQEGGGCSMVLVLGAGAATRYLGGIAYADINRDRRYEPGEGVAGVLVSCGAQKMTTGPSGAWWLALESADAGDVTFTSDATATALTHVVTPAKAPANQAFHWRVPIKGDRKFADKLIKQTQHDLVGKDDEHQRTPLIKLLVGTRMTIIDDDQQKQIAAMVTPVKEDFDTDLHKVQSSLQDEPDDVKKFFTTLERRWKAAIPAWVKESESLWVMHDQITTLVGTPTQLDSHRSEVVKQLQKSMAQTNDPEFLEQYLVWLGMVDRGSAEAIGEKPLE